MVKENESALMSGPAEESSWASKEKKQKKENEATARVIVQNTIYVRVCAYLSVKINLNLPIKKRG